MNPSTWTRNCHTRAMRNSTDELIGKALSSPLFIQEREEPANLRQTYHSHEESLLPAQPFYTYKYGQTRVRTKVRFVSKTEFKSRQIQKHDLQAESDKRSIQEFTGIVDSQRMEIDHAITRCEQSRREQQLLQEAPLEQHRALRENCIRNVRDMEELQKSHVLKVEELSRRKLTKDQDTIVELRAQIQELQNEVNCTMTSRDFMDAESVRSGPCRNNQPPDIWNSLGISGNVFCKSTSVFFVTLSRRIQSLDS